MFRGTVRPLHVHPVLRGLRFTGYVDKDAYVKNADRTRTFFTTTFEHTYLNAAVEYVSTKDQESATKTARNGRGYSVFVTPKTTKGWEGLVRFDHLIPNKDVKSQVRQRMIAGVAYWFPHQGNVSTVLMFDVDRAKFDGLAATQLPWQRNLAVHALVNF